MKDRILAVVAAMTAMQDNYGIRDTVDIAFKGAKAELIDIAETVDVATIVAPVAIVTPAGPSNSDLAASIEAVDQHVDAMIFAMHEIADAVTLIKAGALATAAAAAATTPADPAPPADAPAP